MQVPVFYGDQERGTLRAEQKGLYTSFYGQLRETGLCRVYGVFSGGECSLGIPVPEQGRMVLRATVPTSRLPGGRLLSGRLVLQGEGFLPFPGGIIGGVTYPAGAKKGTVLRFHWKPGQPLPAEELLCFYRPVREGGKLYLELRLKEDGTPEV